MIKKIVIKDVASYDAEGVVLDDLRKVNFIYGGNGTGKTTISRVLGSVNPEVEFPGCEVEWAGAPRKVLVYNKDFKERNFQENIPGVFTIGEDAVDAMNDIDLLKEHLEELARKLRDINYRRGELQKVIDSRQQELVKTVWENTNKLRTEWSKCLDEGMTKYEFTKKLINTMEHGLQRNVQHAKDIRRRYGTLFEERDAKRKDLVFLPTLSFAEAESVTSDKKWNESLPGGGQEIGGMVTALQADEWVKKGIELVNKHHLEVCPFCQRKTMDSRFMHQMSEYFSEHYRQYIEALKEMKERYEITAREIMKGLRDILNRKDLGQEGEEALNRELCETEVEMLQDRLAYNIEIMNAKLKDPAITVEFRDISSIEKKLSEKMIAVSEVIKEHNNMVADIEVARLRLKEDVWAYLASQTEKSIKATEQIVRKTTKKLNKLTEEEKPIQKEYDKTKKDIEQREESLSSAQPAIDNINNALRQFGFMGFSIQPSSSHKNYYQVQRGDGELALNTLSEGEATFITFLYYMQQLNGYETTEMKKDIRIAVIDDPISSLDSNVLFVVSEMVRKLIEEIRSKNETKSGVEQLFVLTHNVYFHKEVAFINMRANKRKDTHHWLLYKYGGVSSIKACGMENPIKGSYDLLWKELRDHQKDLGKMDSISLQNTIRRIIDTYFVTFGGKARKNLIPENFSEDSDELTIARSFDRWFNEGSHDIMDDFYVEHPRELNEKYIELFKRLFERAGHGAHYEMMMREES